MSAAADFAAHKTITLPDTRGRAIHGLDNLGGTAANRVTNAVCGIIGTTMGAVGGDQNVQQHTHTVNDPGHVHGINDPGHSHTPNVILSAGGGSQDPGGPNNTPGAMNSATTGITIVSANTGITNANFGIGSSANMSPAIMMTKIIKL